MWSSREENSILGIPTDEISKEALVEIIKLLLADSKSRDRPKNGQQTDKRTEEPKHSNYTTKTVDHKASKPNNSNRPLCKNYLKGSCKFGANCWNLHENRLPDKQKNGIPLCKNCRRTGHKENECWKKYPEKAPKRNTAARNTDRLPNKGRHHALSTVCTFCGMRGHFITNCNSLQKFSKIYKTEIASRLPPYCERCKTTGHTTERCRQSIIFNEINSRAAKSSPILFDDKLNHMGTNETNPGDQLIKIEKFFLSMKMKTNSKLERKRELVQLIRKWKLMNETLKC